MIRNLKIIDYRNPVLAKCPECKTFGKMRRSRSRTLLEQIIKRMTHFRIYSCENCDWRGYRSTLVFARNSLKSLFIYFVLMLVTAYIVYFILQQFV